MSLYKKYFVLNNHKWIFPSSNPVGFVNTLPLEDLVNVDLPNGLVNNPCWSWRHIRLKYFKELLDHSMLRADSNKSTVILLLATTTLSWYISKNQVFIIFSTYALLRKISSYGDLRPLWYAPLCFSGLWSGSWPFIQICPQNTVGYINTM